MQTTNESTAEILSQFIQGYFDALEWSTPAETLADIIEDEASDLSGFEWDIYSKADQNIEVINFLLDNISLLEKAVNCDGYSWSRAGHDLWMTRAGHGVGFWDRDALGPIGDQLTTAVDQWNQKQGYGLHHPEPYIGDDGRIHV